MSIPLFEHNEMAYEKAEAMLQKTGRAAVIHPTGTGKSFVGFRFAEKHPERNILWLSPSAYIFRTQQENLRKAAPDAELSNIAFLTYARLMMMEEEEMTSYHPDLIILDEFHRCGAREWGSSLQRFLKLHPEAGLLGLSATHIRYLDNQRDMAEELFAGNIASYMTLGEAIALGILKSPKYIVSIYGYEKELERYRQRIDRVKSKGYRHEQQKYLDMLKRSLENADGLAEIFTRHMEQPKGKYILFCSGRDHMEEMISHTEEWFGALDKAPHIYRVFSEGAEAERSFDDFKADDDDHLRLLYCIDMLNEGVHVENVDGVILFRPTTSPIVYKQQIGRAMSSAGGKEPVIFDVVNNFDSLYSISSIQKEVEDIAAYYREHGEGHRIVTERFQIHDESRQSRKLFEELERSLSATWELCYNAAEAYYKEHGDLEVPKRYQSPEGISLGQWIITQKRVRSGQIPGNLSEGQIARLDAIGMVWENRLELSWERYYAAAQRFYEAKGHLDVSADHETLEGIPLGRWIVQNRQYRAAGSKKALITEERIQRLNAIGMIWDKNAYLWEKHYEEAQSYYEAHGNLDIPYEYEDASGMKLGRWIVQMRRKKADSILPREQVSRLEAIGMRWTMEYEELWEQSFAHAEKYAKMHMALDVPGTYIDEEGFALGKWLYKQKIRYEEGKLPGKQAARLEAIGMELRRKDPWEERYAIAKEYFENHGDLRISQHYVTDSGIWLGKWLYEQRRSKASLTPEQRQRLEAIGMDWLSPMERAWENQYSAAERYYREHGDLMIPADYKSADGKSVKRWMKKQLEKKQAGALPPQQAARLEAIGL